MRTLPRTLESIARIACHGQVRVSQLEKHLQRCESAKRQGRDAAGAAERAAAPPPPYFSRNVNTGNPAPDDSGAGCAHPADVAGRALSDSDKCAFLRRLATTDALGYGSLVTLDKLVTALPDSAVATIAVDAVRDLGAFAACRDGDLDPGTQRLGGDARGVSDGGGGGGGGGGGDSTATCKSGHAERGCAPGTPVEGGSSDDAMSGGETTGTPTERRHKHRVQEESITHHLAATAAAPSLAASESGSDSANWVVVELGAGTGGLGKAVQRLAPHAPTVLVDNQRFKPRHDRSWQEAGSGVEWARATVDLRHLVLNSLPLVNQSGDPGPSTTDTTTEPSVTPSRRSIVLVAKHLCGVATDLAITATSHLHQTAGEWGLLHLANC
jgi:hypothetical protein